MHVKQILVVLFLNISIAAFSQNASLYGRVSMRNPVERD